MDERSSSMDKKVTMESNNFLFIGAPLLVIYSNNKDMSLIKTRLAFLKKFCQLKSKEKT